MNILLLTLSDFDSFKSKGIYPDLMNEFLNNNHNVYVISPTERKKHAQTQLKCHTNSYILKLKIGNIQKTNIIEKGISTLIIESQFIQGIKKYFSDIKFDLVIYATPPITFAKVIKYIKKRDGAKSYLLLKDIFPQNAIDLEMFSKQSFIYKYFRNKEKMLYQLSDHIGCMSKANVDFILKHNNFIDKNKVEVCPNSISPTVIEKYFKKIRDIKEKYSIPKDKIIFVYGGNLGKPQGIDFLIECINSCNINEVFFLIIGSGTEFNKLQNFFDNEKPKNAMLYSSLPKEEYEILVNACDVGLIFLDKRFTIPNFPSRLLSYMQASMPILAATDVNTDIGEIIEKGEFGYWVESGNIEMFNEKVNQLYSNKDKLNIMGKKSRKYLEENYTVEHSYNIIMKHFM